MEITTKELSKARSQIMGIATLLVIIVHLYIGPESHLTESIHRFAQIGVDIFFFLSGIGCYQSISKRSTLEFYQRRINRVLPVYLLLFIVYGMFKCGFEGLDAFSYWWTHSIIMFPIDGQTRHWFVCGILILYFLTPAFYKMRDTYAFWITFAGIIILSSALWFSPYPISENIYAFNEIFITRIPIYMLGMYFGERLSEDKPIIIDTTFYLKLIGSIILMFWASYFNSINTMTIFHYTCIFGTIYFTFFLAMIFNKVKIAPLSALGKCSLESYLLNEKIIAILTTYTSLNALRVNIYGFILTFVGAIILKAFVNLITEPENKI